MTDEVERLRQLLADLVRSGVLINHRLSDQEQDRLYRTVDQASIGEPFDALGDLHPSLPIYLDERGAADVLEELGRFIVRWNRAEEAVRSVLVTLLNTSDRPDQHLATIFVGRLQADGLVEILTRYAKTYETRALASRLGKLATYLQKLTVYRNQYVHGIIGTKNYPYGGPYNYTRWSQAVIERLRPQKQGVVYEYARLRAEAFRQAGEWTLALEAYCRSLQQAIKAFLAGTRPMQWPDLPPMPSDFQRSMSRVFHPSTYQRQEDRW